MSVLFTVEWRVQGSSTIEVSDEELNAAGVTEHDIESNGARWAFEKLNKNSDGDLVRELADSWDERDNPVPVQVEATGEDGWML